MSSQKTRSMTSSGTKRKAEDALDQDFKKMLKKTIDEVDKSKNECLWILLGKKNCWWRYRYCVPFRTLYRWKVEGKMTKEHHKKGQKSPVKPLELLLFE